MHIIDLAKCPSRASILFSDLCRILKVVVLVKRKRAFSAYIRKDKCEELNCIDANLIVQQLNNPGLQDVVIYAQIYCDLLHYAQSKIDCLQSDNAAY